MSAHDTTPAPPPAGARPLRAGELIEDGDLHWQPAVNKWVAVTPQGEERVTAEQVGFYCRKIDE